MSTNILADGFAFLEGPRWHDGALWVSDMHDERVFRITLDGARECVADVPERPSGLGWLPDGDLLIASMMDKTLLRISSDGRLRRHARIGELVPRRINDMLVDSAGRAYVGNFGFIFDEGEPPAPTVLIRVDPDSSVHTVANGLVFPNGMALTPDEKLLIVAETFGARLTAFDVAPDGSLSNQRLWASMNNGAVPDGICIDAQNGVWVASPTTGEVLRIVEGGNVTDRIMTGRQAIACALGGQTGHTLFITTSESTDREACRSTRSARIEYVDVEVSAP